MGKKANAQAEAAPRAENGPQPPVPERNRPVHVVRLRNIRAALWANESDGATWYNVTVSRLYKDEEGRWRTSDGFGRDDLLLLAKVLDAAHSWICEQLQGQDVPF